MQIYFPFIQLQCPMFVSIGLIHFLYPISDVIVFCCFLSGVVRLVYINEGINVCAMEKFFRPRLLHGYRSNFVRRRGILSNSISASICRTQPIRCINLHQNLSTSPSKKVSYKTFAVCIEFICHEHLEIKKNILQ